MTWVGCKGFTLIEILVVIGLISLVAVVGIPNLRRFNQDQIFTEKTSEIINHLKRMQSNSQAGIVCDQGYRSTSWNLKITGANTYITYPKCINSSGAEVSGNPQETIPIPDESGVKIDNIETCAGTTCSDFSNKQLNISFINSSRLVGFSGTPDPPVNTDKVNIYLSYQSQITGISITRGGSINVCTLNSSKKCI